MPATRGMEPKAKAQRLAADAKRRLKLAAAALAYAPPQGAPPCPHCGASGEAPSTVESHKKPPTVGMSARVKTKVGKRIRKIAEAPPSPAITADPGKRTSVESKAQPTKVRAKRDTKAKTTKRKTKRSTKDGPKK